ncbi:MAG TPA: MFS transporter [Terracidiphilus sp.]|jgi:ACS family tartrate transporter-like MFS transporter|nr:MFS transporter [Terracidiphilus sp.]
MSAPGPIAPNAASGSDAENMAIGASAQRKAAWRLLPVISIGYGLAYIDRINISFASLRMNADLHFSATIYGMGAGLFFIAYALCEVPSNLLLLRFGARRWLARIMLTWGLLAAAMMFVRTPVEFYAVRFLLGMAEAGFFPGVIYYLTLWFPASMRARAVSRFYVALPLGSVVMGSLAGWLLDLNGKLGLAGWQWLFLVEGLPAALYSFVILRMLPDAPAKAAWLSDAEKQWLRKQLAADSQQAHLGHEAGVLRALLSPKVWMMGGFFFFLLMANYALTFSLPAILQASTGWSVTHVGYLVAGFGLLGAVGMLAGGASSDRSGERQWHCIVPCCVMGVGFLLASSGRPAWLVVTVLAVVFTAFNAILAPGLAVATQFMTGRAAAAGLAAMNTITMFSGFVGPYWMGRAYDATGSYWAGLRGLVLPCFAAAAVMLVLTRSLKRSAPVVATPALAQESA